MRGYVQVYTGKGKGKTTAALGLAIRAAGAGLRVFIAQFAKGGEYSEIKALQRFQENITVKQYGRGVFINGKPAEEDVLAAREGLTEARERMVSGEYDVVILDEANIATLLNLIAVGDLLDFIRIKPYDVELVITGRSADPLVMEQADLVTEMAEVKHYYQSGVQAREGIEK
jgi:cob(I)alamin adenosyltransferase